MHRPVILIYYISIYGVNANVPPVGWTGYVNIYIPGKFYIL